jgi:hypothetical protein
MRKVEMNREIKFRGKYLPKHNEPSFWCYGSLLKCERYNSIGYDIYNSVDENNPMGIYPIDPTTVGQFTGLQDKNGKDIYEGDIIRTANVAVGVVYFDVKKQSYLFDCSKGWKHPIYGMGGKKEIIGNITDNPELLEGE